MLNLQFNRIGNFGASALLRPLSGMPTPRLEVLDLSFNGITLDGDVLIDATATQALKVGAATTVRDNKIQVSTDKESKGVADDRAEADQIEGDAVAAHRVAVDAETAKCV